MKKKQLFFLLFFLFILSAGAENKQPDDDPTVVSLITCSPGKEVYTVFGHSAIRVKNPVEGHDIVFNYGIFDFNTDNFYVKFIKGETDYKVVVYDFDYFLPEYRLRNSTVWEQELNLSSEEKHKLIVALFKNCEPQNSIYRYNFVFDNCATRPRDKIYESVNGRVEGNPFNEQKTFREWVAKYTNKDSWLMFGIDMLFGAESDKLAGVEQSMFLPEILMQEFDHKEIFDVESETIRPLVSKTTVLYRQKPEEQKKTFFLFQPLVFSYLIFSVFFLLSVFRKKSHFINKIIDSLLYLGSGAVGGILFFLMFFSEHPMVGENYNLLWLNPLFFLAAIGIWGNMWSKAFLYLMFILFISLLLALLSVAFSLQFFNPAFIPCILILLISVACNLRLIIRQRYLIYKLNEIEK